MRAICSTIMILAMLAPGWAASPKVPPSLYMVNGKPVPVSCLSTLGGFEGDPDIDLTHCGDPSIKPETLSSGLVGYSNPQGGYFYYRYIGQIEDLDIFYTVVSGGGSGERASLTGVKRQDRILHPVHTYGGGDRCNGAVDNAIIVQGRLYFDKKLTSGDFIALAKGISDSKEIEILDNSPRSCIGLEHVIGDAKQWTGVTFYKGAGEDPVGWETQHRPAWAEDYHPQACFNAIVRDVLGRGQAELNQAGVKAFAEEFTRRCMQKKF